MYNRCWRKKRNYGSTQLVRIDSLINARTHLFLMHEAEVRSQLELMIVAVQVDLAWHRKKNWLLLVAANIFV